MKARLVTVLTIHHRHGCDASVHNSPERAYEALVDYAKRDWVDEIPDIEVPDDDSALIDRYFEEMEGREYYDLYENLPIN